MLVIQIALGIVLGFIILAYLPQIIKSISILGVFLIALSLIGLLLILIGSFYKNIIMYASMPYIFIVGFTGTYPLYILVKDWIKKIITDFDSDKNIVLAMLMLGFTNFIIAAIICDYFSILNIISEWSYNNGYKDSLAMYIIGFFMLWPWILVSFLPQVKKEIKEKINVLKKATQSNL